MKLYQPIILGLLSFAKAKDDSSGHDVQESTLNSDQNKIINDLKHKLKEIESENERLSQNNKYLTEKMSKQQKRQQEILFAMSWKYEQLERKAQTYYNSFQTQKQNLGKIVNKYTEPVRTGQTGQSPLIPMYLWSEMNNKRKNELAEKANMNSDNNTNNETGEYIENPDGSINGVINADEIEEAENNAPVARSAGRRYNPLNGITLKSALGSSKNKNDNYDSGIGSISEYLRKRTRASDDEENHGLNFRANNRYQRISRSHNFFKKLANPVKLRRLNPLNNNENAEINDVLEGVNFIDHYKKHSSVGGIRR